MAERWYDKSIKQTEMRLETDANFGLSGDTIRQRRKLDGYNDIYPAPKKNFRAYLAHLLTDYTSLLLLITLLIAAVFHETENLFIMLLILVTYYTIAMVTYVKSQDVLENMGRSALPNAKVMRGGRIFMVKQKQLVRGDVVYVSAGDIIPCDARLVESRGLEILEVNVTGVTHAVRKDAEFIHYHDIAPAQQKNMLFASTIVTRGTGRAICCETGSDTLVCAMGKNQPMVSHERLEILDRIGRFCKVWTLTMTLLIFVLTVADLLIGVGAKEGIFGSFMTGLSLAVASMSEFYTAFAYIVLACGIFGAVNRKKDINRGALIKNSAKLEDIKNLTCLIVPREAAFSIRDMALEKVFANGDVYAVGEHGYRRNASRVLRYALISTGRYGAGKLIENNLSGDNVYTSEEEAILKAAESESEYHIGLDRRYPMLDHCAKGNRSRFDTTLVRYENGYVVSLRGDYRTVLPLCRYYTEDSRVYPMTEEKWNEILIAAEQLAKESYRVLAVASKDTMYKSLKRLSSCQTDLTFEGLLAIREPHLPDAAKNVLRAKNAGLKVLLLTPDVSESNAILAESLGIATEARQSITGEELSHMKEGLFRANLDIYTVYQGLNLAQRRLLVRFLQEKGERVGYLCSELDEIILMKEADVGFSQSITLSEKAGGTGIDLAGRNIPIYTKDPNEGGSGCEALKFVSDVVVSEPDKSGTGGFNAMLETLLYAKGVYYNLYRMLKYMIASQVAKLTLIFLALVLGFTALTPPQILFCGLMIDFAALIIIAFERPDYTLLSAPTSISEKLKAPFWRNIDAVVIGVLLAVVTIVTSLYLQHYHVLDVASLPTFCFVSLLVSQLSLLNECKRERSVFDPNVRFNGAYLTFLLLFAVFVTLIFTVSPIGILFAVQPLSLFACVALVLPGLVVTLCYEIYKMIQRREDKSSL
ncbi:MAG: cation-transporting P-type ATPase [Ruminococcaceae bacterium]|nr:cation-transporting P-type ATPase [Oscillospiraceae bacterium]